MTSGVLSSIVFGVPVSELLLLAGLIIVAGFVTGILAGLFGIGGGALIVPVLYEVFRVLGVPDEVRFQLCVGTSIAIIVPTNVLSFRIHRDKGLVMMDVLRAWAVPAVVGVAAGSAIAAFAPAAVLKLAFALIASVIAFKLLAGRDSWRLAEDLPGADKFTQSAQTSDSDKSTQSAQTSDSDKSTQSARRWNAG